jgi:hypothetical protein
MGTVAMTRTTFTITAIAFVCSTAAAAQQEIKCESPVNVVVLMAKAGGQ